MERHKLKVDKRQVVGRKVKKLRREGVLPANIYGKKTASVTIQVNLAEFQKIYQAAGETGIIELEVEGEKEVRPVLIHHLQVHPVTDEPLHVAFHQVILTERTTATIPIEFSGESPAVAQKIGIFVQPIAALEVEALPADLPEKLTVDIAGLREIGEAVFVKEIKVDRQKVEIKAGENEIVAKIEPPAKEEVVEKPTAAAPEAAGETAAPVAEEEKMAAEETKPTAEVTE
jgi:large subunit ribosomal protein L25